MKPSDSPDVAAVVQSVVEDISQRILRGLDLTRPAPVSQIDPTTPDATSAGVLDVLGGAPRRVAILGVDLACRMVETACERSRSLAMRALGLPASPAAGATAKTSDRTAGHVDQGEPASPPPAPGSMSAPRPSTSSPLLANLAWAGRVTGPARASTTPDGVVRIPISLENRTGAQLRAVRLRSTDFVGRGGSVILSDAVRIEPPVVQLPPHSSREVVIELHVPRDAAPGGYTGVVSALGLTGASSTVEVEVY